HEVPHAQQAVACRSFPDLWPGVRARLSPPLRHALSGAGHLRAAGTGPLMGGSMILSREDIEYTFIRSLACSGFILSGPTMSPDDRRERIRIAIMKSQMSNKPLPIEPSLTYAEAFKLAYNRPCELRRIEREDLSK